MKRVVLVITTTIVLIALLSTGVRIAGSQNSEPIILEPIVKAQDCTTKFGVQNLGSESTAVTRAFRDELEEILQPELQSKLESSSPEETIDVLVLMDKQADLSWAAQMTDKANRREAVIRALKEVAGRSQKGIVGFLGERANYVDKF